MPDFTQLQNADEQRRAAQLSADHLRPPADVPGYELRRFLGAGAYGEVWVAVDRVTGRQVAIKFYAHRGGLDWSLLSHEVEKLAFLSADRYVVQLLDVGWTAEPPYYVMEYVGRGSLDERLQVDGTLAVDEAVTLFREVAVGLLHAHAKGVLHCDLKPANVLLDEDGKPRLADFGQSRLSHEQKPALGTLFYMAPEQADLQAVPDARWDVYALGALLYCMLTGGPPHRSDDAVQSIETTADLDDRLARYRQTIARAPAPSSHRQVRGVDRRLAEIIDRCLATDPRQRFPNMQLVINALDQRARHRARRPLLALGVVGPLLLLTIVSLAAWRWLNTAVTESNHALIKTALESNQLQASNVALLAGAELDRRFRAVEQLAADPAFQDALDTFLRNPDLQPLLGPLSDPNLSEAELEPLRQRFRQHPAVDGLRQQLALITSDENQSDVHSWFISDPNGLQLARVAPGDPTNVRTMGLNYAFRPYFSGRDRDLAPQARPQPLGKTRLSPAFVSQASGRWIVAVSTPVIRPEALEMGRHEKLLGVLCLTFEVGRRFITMPEEPDHFAVLLEQRVGDQPGLVLQHPLFDALAGKSHRIPERLMKYRVPAANLPVDPEMQMHYIDPLATDPAGSSYDRRWLAEEKSVVVRGRPVGWMVVVQESYEGAIGDTLDKLKSSMIAIGGVSLAIILVVVGALWFFVLRIWGDRGAAGKPMQSSSATAK